MLEIFYNASSNFSFKKINLEDKGEKNKRIFWNLVKEKLNILTGRVSQI